MLAFITEEPDGEVVARYKGTLVILTIGVTEITARLAGTGLDEDAIRSIFDDLDAKIEPYDFETALLAGMLRPENRHLGLGDRATIAFAIRSGLPVLTADHAWEQLELDGLTVIPIR